jgi:hypothetical protein
MFLVSGSVCRMSIYPCPKKFMGYCHLGIEIICSETSGCIKRCSSPGVLGPCDCVIGRVALYIPRVGFTGMLAKQLAPMHSFLGKCVLHCLHANSACIARREQGCCTTTHSPYITQRRNSHWAIRCEHNFASPTGGKVFACATVPGDQERQ